MFAWFSTRVRFFKEQQKYLHFPARALLIGTRLTDAGHLGDDPAEGRVAAHGVRVHLQHVPRRV